MPNQDLPSEEQEMQEQEAPKTEEEIAAEYVEPSEEGQEEEQEDEEEESGESKFSIGGKEYDEEHLQTILSEHSKLEEYKEVVNGYADMEALLKEDPAQLIHNILSSDFAKDSDWVLTNKNTGEEYNPVPEDPRLAKEREKFEKQKSEYEQQQETQKAQAAFNSELEELSKKFNVDFDPKDFNNPYPTSITTKAVQRWARYEEIKSVEEALKFYLEDSVSEDKLKEQKPKKRKSPTPPKESALSYEEKMALKYLKE